MQAERLRALILWPHPRGARVQACLANRELHEEMDGLSYLADYGIEPMVLDSSRYPFNPLTKRGSVLAGLDPLRFLRLLTRYRSFDVLVSMDTSSGFFFMQTKRLFRLRKPIVVVDPALDIYPNRKRIHDRVLPQADEVVVFAKVQQRYLEQEYGGRVKAAFVRHRIDAAFFDARKATPRRDGYILTVGNDTARDYETLCAAVEHLNVPVVIHSKKDIACPIPKNVEVRTDWITFEELRDLYAGALAVVVPVHPSVHASGINGLLEAMAMGKPVVASNSEGIADYLEEGRNALVVPAEDSAALRAVLERLLEDGELRARLGRQARTYCDEACAMPVYAKTIAEILRRAAGSPARSQDNSPRRP